MAGDQAPAALSAEQLQAVATAKRRGRGITRAAGISAFSGWTLAFFALITLLGGLFSLPALLLGLALAGIAWIELRGSRRLRSLDPAAGTQLGFNQLALAAIIIAYAGWSMARAAFGPSPYESHLAAGGPVADTLAPIDRLQRTVTFAFYAALILISILAQGSLSAYYFTRRRRVLDFLRETPAWIVDMLRIAAA